MQDFDVEQWDLRLGSDGLEYRCKGCRRRLLGGIDEAEEVRPDEGAERGGRRVQAFDPFSKL